MSNPIYKGAAKQLEDIDLPRIGGSIGVGEDPLHALIEVETLGDGFDSQGRPKLLFEPHKFYHHLRKDRDKQAEAVRAGLAYRTWGTQKYPRESYTRLDKAIAIDEHAAYLSGSWGGSQIMGENHKLAGYDTVEEMVTAFAADEDNHIEAMISFIKATGIDDDLRRIEKKTERGEKVTAQDWVPIVRVYNGAGFAKNDYHNRVAKAYHKWLKIKDTPYAAGAKMRDLAAAETQAYDGSIANVPADDAFGPEEPAAQPHKGVTTGDTSDETAGTPPPTPAVEIKASESSWKTKIGSLSIPTGVGVVITAIGSFAKGLPPYAWFAFAAVLIAAMVVGFLVWKTEKNQAHERTLKVMDAGADQKKNNLRLV